jgi:integrase
MAKKRGRGEGSIEQRDGIFRLRYRINGKKQSKTMPPGTTKEQARKELRALVYGVDTGEAVEPSKLTVAQWIDQWLDLGAPGRRRMKVSQRTLERYSQLLRTHIQPVLGKRPLQKLTATEIDKLYADIAAAAEIAPRTQHHVHVVFSSLLATAERKGLIAVNPMKRVGKVPNPNPDFADEDSEGLADDIGEGLGEADLAKLVAGFKPSSLYPIVAVAAATGARRNELLALRWSDLDIAQKTIRIEWALEQTKKHGIRRKRPKTKRGWRTIGLDDAIVAVLLIERDRHLRIQAGIPDGIDVDLGLIKLPAGALMFPAVTGRDFDFNTPRNPRNFSKEFARRAGLLDFEKTRFHDLRGIHTTALLDAGIPVHTVAQRIGDDPAVLLRNYAKRKRTQEADKKLTDTISTIASGFLGT